VTRELTTWIAALEAGYTSYEVVSTWANARLDSMPTIPVWFSDLVWVSSDEEALSALWSARGSSDFSSSSTLGFAEPAELIDGRSLYLGFVFLRFEAGEVSAPELLKRCGDKADGWNLADPECSAFYLLLNEFDGGGPVLSSTIPLERRILKLFAPFRDSAITEWRRLFTPPN
jgi:hypothetical protein